MRHAVLILWCLASVGAWFFGRLHLARFLLTLSFEMPLWLEKLIRWGLWTVIQDDKPDPEDIETIGIGLLILASFVVVAPVIFMVSIFGWRRLNARRFRGR